MIADASEELEKNKVIIWILGLVAVAAVIFDLFRLLPLFNAYFIRDDYLFLDLGAFMRQQDPFAFLTATCIGWWRPIALVLPALVYLLFGLNPLPFHVLAYLIHLLTGITLVLLCRKFFDVRIGLIAFAIYIAAPISFSNVGWMLGAIEDETATMFYLLALYSQLRLNPKEKPGPYYLPALFLVLGSFCKITWLGLIPALLFMDWVNYPKSRLVQRFIRFTPFLIFIPTLFLNFVFIGFEHLGGSFLPNFNDYFIARNIIRGAFLSFIPIDMFLYIKSWFRVIIIIPVAFFLLALLFTKLKSRMIAIGVSYLGILAILGLAQIQNHPLGWIMGWRHLTPLVGFAAIILAVSLSRLIKLRRLITLGLMAAILLLGALIWSGLSMKSNLKEEIEKEDQFNRNSLRGFIVLCRSSNSGTDIYIIGRKPLSVNLLADLAGSDHSLAMLFVKREGIEFMHNYDARSKHFILKESEEMMTLLNGLTGSTNVMFLTTDEKGNWSDISGYDSKKYAGMLDMEF